MWQRVPSRISQTQRPGVRGDRRNPSGSPTATDQSIKISIVVIVKFFILFIKVF